MSILPVHSIGAAPHNHLVAVIGCGTNFMVAGVSRSVSRGFISTCAKPTPSVNQKQTPLQECPCQTLLAGVYPFLVPCACHVMPPFHEHAKVMPCVASISCHVSLACHDPVTCCHHVVCSDHHMCCRRVGVMGPSVFCTRVRLIGSPRGSPDAVQNAKACCKGNTVRRTAASLSVRCKVVSSAGDVQQSEPQLWSLPPAIWL